MAESMTDAVKEVIAPILEALARYRAFEITIPACGDSNLDTVLEEDSDEGDGMQIEPGGTVRRLTDANGCRADAQLLAVVALTLELKRGTHQSA
jgi:hypothetical protein